VHKNIDLTNLIVFNGRTPVVIDFDTLARKGAVQYSGKFE